MAILDRDDGCAGGCAPVADAAVAARVVPESARRRAARDLCRRTAHAPQVIHPTVRSRALVGSCPTVHRRRFLSPPSSVYVRRTAAAMAAAVFTDNWFSDMPQPASPFRTSVCLSAVPVMRRLLQREQCCGALRVDV